EYGFIVNPEDANNPELLLAAVEKGYLEIVEDLLRYGADVNMLHNSMCKEDFTPLHSAAKKKDRKTPIFYGIEMSIQKLQTTFN
ncbi:MAG: ankyrin repeat domain-containing protein, partial [Wolbachia sp.]